MLVIFDSLAEATWPEPAEAGYFVFLRVLGCVSATDSHLAAVSLHWRIYGCVCMNACCRHVADDWQTDVHMSRLQSDVIELKSVAEYLCVGSHTDC